MVKIEMGSWNERIIIENYVYYCVHEQNADCCFSLFIMCHKMY